MTVLAAQHLVTELREMHTWTLRLLARIPEERWLESIPWTECLVAWHIGHLAWYPDELQARYSEQTAVLGDDWKQHFWSEQPLDPTNAPTREKILRVYEETLERFCDWFLTLPEDVLYEKRMHADGDSGSPFSAMLMLIFHEGEHYAGLDSMRWWWEQQGPASTAAV